MLPALRVEHRVPRSHRHRGLPKVPFHPAQPSRRRGQRNQIWFHTSPRAHKYGGRLIFDRIPFTVKDLLGLRLWAQLTWMRRSRQLRGGESLPQSNEGLMEGQ